MNPYSGLEPNAFWRTACAERSPFDIKELWQPKFNISLNSKVATYGSCFAQHLGKALRAKGYSWLITESSPYGISDSKKGALGYDIFSSRTGNIYTTSLLKQWLSWALKVTQPPAEIWHKNGRYFDPFRPNIEENGFQSAEELLRLRNFTIECFLESIVKSDYFVFTLGLTESWINTEKGYEYQMCPGTVAGTFDESQHKFVNQGYDEVLKNLMSSISMIRSINKKIRFILTVSPVPLTATKSGEHVLVATMRSKSILRAVADEAAARKEYVDYFPSYEIINSPVFRGMFFEPNLRSVNPAGVSLVMENFFRGLYLKYGAPSGITIKDGVKEETDVVCEEQILESFNN